MGRREQGLTLFTGFLWLIGVVVVVQLWLVTAALEALLGGHKAVLLPAACVSAALAAINAALVAFVFRVDNRIRAEVGTPE